MLKDNILRNGGFEAAWDEGESHHCLVVPIDADVYETDIGNIFTPPGWVTWFKHDPGAWDQPEVRDAWASQDERRARSGEKGILLFTFYRRHDAGFFQQVSVEPGQRLRLTAWAHAWSNSKDGPHADDGRWSEGPGYDAGYLLEGSDTPEDSPGTPDDWINFSFYVGIDPTGGTDPTSGNVVWGQGAHIYNEYAQVPAVEAVAESDTVTVFLRSCTRWPFKHNDAYWDDAALVVVEDQPGGNKLGPHVLKSTGDLGSYLAAAPPVAKFVGDWGSAAGVPPGVLVIGRVHSEFDAQSQRRQKPANAAQRFVDSQIEVYRANPHIVYWEGHNEPVWTTEKAMAWYAQFEIERMRIMADLGLKCVIGNFSTGSPDLSLWQAFLPACEAALEYEGILGLHEYSTPWMWWMTGKHQLAPDEDQGDEGWATLRYRKVYRQYLEPAGLGHLPLVITECGLDPNVSPRPEGCPGGAWKTLGKFWAEHDGETDPAAYYYRQLLWYNNELCKDDYVVGATVFTWGSFDRPWSDFDVAESDVATQLIDLAQAYPAKKFVYPGKPETEQWVPPRVDYGRTYVLLPQDADLDWQLAVSAAVADRKFTVGYSADDAGVGPAERRVFAINPSHWPGNLADFFDEHYPGLELASIEAETPWEAALKLLPPLGGDIALGQRWEPWASYDFGEQPGGGTIGGYGCFLTSFAMMLRKLYKVDLTPPVLDKLLVLARSAFIDDNTLVWRSAAKLFPVFDDALHINRCYSAAELADLQADGWEIILRIGSSEHFIYLERVEGDQLHVIDSWNGTRSVRDAAEFTGIRAARVREEAQAAGPWPIGVHASPVLSPPPDNEWDYWLNELKELGVTYYKMLDAGDPRNLEFARRLVDAGIAPIVRLYQANQFPHRLDSSLLDLVPKYVNIGVDLFEIGNEPNLPGEWDPACRDQHDWHNTELVNQVARNWWLDACDVIASGGRPALYAMAPTERGGEHPTCSSVRWNAGILNWLAARHQAPMRCHLSNGRVWLAVHASPFSWRGNNRDIDALLNFDPYGGAVPDDMCALGYTVHKDLVVARFGVQPVIISTEGGVYSPEHIRYLGWPVYSEDEWIELTLRYLKMAHQRSDILAVCTWILTDEGIADNRWKNNGWYRSTEPRDVVQALKRRA